MLVPLIPQDTTDQPAPDEPAPVRQSAGSLLISLAFWSVLATAAAILAAAQLSPHLVRWQDATQLRNHHALELIQLEAELAQLERLAQTLQTDPEFAAAVRAGRYSLDSTGRLLPATHTGLTQSAPSAIGPSEAGPTAQPDYTATSSSSSPPGSLLGLPPIPPLQQILNQTLLPAARQLTANPSLLRQLLWLTTGLTLFAFTCLNTSAAATALTILKLPFTTTVSLHRRYAPRNQHFPTIPPEPVAVPSVPTIIPQTTRSDSSVGRATDS